MSKIETKSDTTLRSLYESKFRNALISKSVILMWLLLTNRCGEWFHCLLSFFFTDSRSGLPGFLVYFTVTCFPPRLVDCRWPNSLAEGPRVTKVNPHGVITPQAWSSKVFKLPGGFAPRPRRGTRLLGQLP